MLPVKGFECSICMNSYSKDDEISLYPCGHYSCRTCIEKIRSSSRKCPMCRATCSDSEVKLVRPTWILLQQLERKLSPEAAQALKLCVSPYGDIASLLHEEGAEALRKVYQLPEHVVNLLYQKKESKLKQEAKKLAKIRDTLLGRRGVPTWIDDLDDIYDEEVEEGRIVIEAEDENEEEDSTPICSFFVRGNCNYGAQCRFRHEKPICKFHLSGCCRSGANCHFKHVIPKSSKNHLSNSYGEKRGTGSSSSSGDTESELLPDPIRAEVRSVVQSKPLGYSQFKHILLVGEGDLSFATYLCKTYSTTSLTRSNRSYSSSSSSTPSLRVAATVLESEASLSAKYKAFPKNKQLIEKLGQKVFTRVNVKVI